jgi:hypothetical protein
MNKLRLKNTSLNVLFLIYIFNKHSYCPFILMFYVSIMFRKGLTIQ